MNHCGTKTQVVNSRAFFGRIKRRRYCTVCKKSFNTLEEIVTTSELRYIRNKETKV